MMLLRSLDGLYDKLREEQRLPPVGYERKRVRFLVELDFNGRCVSIIDTAPDETERLVPEFGRSGKRPPAFVACDTGQYVLGLPQDNQDGSSEKAAVRHAAFIERLNEAILAVQTKDERAAKALSAIREFVSARDNAIRELRDHGHFEVLEFDTNGKLSAASSRFAFRVEGANPVDSPAIQDWWAEIVNEKIGGDMEGVCQVSGVRGQLARVMPSVAVKAGTGQALISANFAAAERYNASQSGGARIAVPVAIRSHQTLNWLLRDPHHHRRIGDLTFVWWLETDVTFDPLNVIAQPHEDDVKALLDSPWTGRPGLSPSDEFRLLGLSLTEARVVIRFDHLSTLADVERRTHHWFEAIAQTDRDGRTWWPGITRLAEAGSPPGEGSARKVRRDRFVEALARTAVTGLPLPRSLLAALVDRCRAVPVPRNGTRVDWTALGARLACLRLATSFMQEEMMKDNQSVGELCGRLLAHLEYAQYRGLGELNRTLVDRYYASASVMPRTVFPGLFKTANAHISRVGRGPGRGAQIAIKKRLSELCDQINMVGGFPAILSLEQQADFALGFWGEQQARFQRMRAEPITTTAKSDEEE